MKPTCHRIAAALIASGLLLAGLPGQAATATAPIGVSATFTTSCNVSGGTINFGSAIDPTSAAVPIDASTSLTVICSATTPYSVALNAGVNAGGNSNFSARSIKNGLNSLGYQLYSDVLHSTIWGDGTSTSTVTPGVGTGSNQLMTVYGRLPSVTGAVPGAYTDTVTVTVTY